MSNRNENKKTLIKLDKISKSFGDRKILDNISLEIYEGELITIMGKSGAGKTTLLNILGFLENVDKGDYYFDGKLVSAKLSNVIRNRNIGFVFQAYNLIPKLTVYENIVLPIYYSDINAKEKKRYIDRLPDMMRKYNIEHIKDSYVDYISGGEKQRVCLARALACDAKLIISDEPTGNLDAQNTDIVLEELAKMNKLGKTVIIVTHDEEVEKIATRKLYLGEGKINNHDI